MPEYDEESGRSATAFAHFCMGPERFSDAVWRICHRRNRTQGAYRPNAGSLATKIAGSIVKQPSTSGGDLAQRRASCEVIKIRR